MKRIFFFVLFMILISTLVSAKFLFGPEAPPPSIINVSNFCQMNGDCTLTNLTVINFTTAYDYNVTHSICIGSSCISNLDNLGNWNKTGAYTFLANPSDNVGIGVSTPSSKLFVEGDITLDTMAIGGNATLSINSELNYDACINLTEGNAYGFKICNDGSGSNELKIGNYLTDKNYMIIDRDDGITTFLNTTKTTLSTDDITIGGYMGVRLNNDNRFIKMGNPGNDVSHILFDDNDQLAIGTETLYSSDGSTIIELMRFKREGGTDLPLIGIGTETPTSRLHVIGNASIGGIDNYVSIDETGYVKLFGDAKGKLTFRPALDFINQIAHAKPTQISRNSFKGYSMPIYNDDDEELFFKMRVPYRWDGISDLSLKVLVSLSADEDIGDQFKFNFTWNHVNTTGLISDTSCSISSQTVVLVDRNVAYNTYSVPFVIDYIDSGCGQIFSRDMLGGKLYRVDAAVPEVANEIIVWDWAIEYQVDKMYGKW